MTHVKAREWIKRIPETRTDAIDAGCKGVLQEIWDHVTWSIHRAPVGRERPWVSREEIADAIGSKPGTVADRIRKLTDAGWLRWDGRCWQLAWEKPWAWGDESAATDDSTSPRRLDRSATPPVPTDDSTGGDRRLHQSPATRPVGDSTGADRRLDRRRPTTPPVPGGDSGRPKLSNQELSTELSTIGDGSPNTPPAQVPLIPLIPLDTPAPEPPTKRTRKRTASPNPNDEDSIRIRDWWADTYLPIRAETFARWRPEAQTHPLTCTDDRVKDIRSRLHEYAKGQPWERQRDVLTHVVRAAALRVDRQRGESVPYGKGTYDTMRNILPDYWLRRGNFTSLAEETLPAATAEPKREEIPRWLQSDRTFEDSRW